MSLYARSDLASVTVSAAHGGCGQVHVRSAPGGKPDPVWKLDCVPCESHLRDDPLWSPTLSEVPETPDETKSREDFEKRGALDRDQVMALAMAKLAGVDLPDTMRRPVSGLQPHIPVVAGEILCDTGHSNEAGSKFCSECGSALREPGKRLCPDGHEVTPKMRFCPECGQGITPVSATVPAIESPAPAEGQETASRRKPLKDMRAADLKAIARERGVDDSGSRAEVLARLRAA